MTNIHTWTETTANDVSAADYANATASAKFSHAITWRAVADAVSSIALLSAVTWGMWNVAIHVTQWTPQIAAAWERYPF